MLIRHATMDDLTAIATVEAACFPAAEAAGADALRNRLAVYPDCFWLMIDDGRNGDVIPADAAGRDFPWRGGRSSWRIPPKAMTS